MCEFVGVSRATNVVQSWLGWRSRLSPTPGLAGDDAGWVVVRARLAATGHVLCTPRWSTLRDGNGPGCRQGRCWIGVVRASRE